VVGLEEIKNIESDIREASGKVKKEIVLTDN
jgi:hypothetical protein